MASRRFFQLTGWSKLYVSVVVFAGALAVVHSIDALARGHTAWSWVILAVLTLVSGSATIKLPSLPATITVSETFVFTSVLLFGTAAGTLTVALDALVISFWSYKRGHPFYKIVFNLFALPLTIWISARVFFLQTGVVPLFYGHVGSTDLVAVKSLLLPLFGLATTYFLLNSWTIAFAIALEKGQSAYGIWRQHFLWLSLNYFGGASVAALLVSYSTKLDYTYLALILPLIVILYFTFSTTMGRVADANLHVGQLNRLHLSTIETLAMAIDAKDQITHGHIRRVQTYAVGLAKRMGIRDESLIKAVEAAALLHDMGKLAVPEYILNKPGPLTPAEFEKMKLHASVGADILSAIEFPYPVVPIVRHHHENWNGTGYPAGLSGSEIPIGARILSVVDCFDALTSDRPYRSRLSDTAAIEILIERRGIMYDPDVVDTFVAVHADIAPPLGERAREVLSSDTTTDRHEIPTSRERPDVMAAVGDDAAALLAIATDLRVPADLAQTSDLIAKHVRRLIPCELIVLYLYNGQNDELSAVYSSGEQADLVLGLRIGLGRKLSGWVAANRQTIRNSDPVLDFGEIARSMPTRPRSCLSCPLTASDQLVGVLALYSGRADAFTESDQHTLEAVAGRFSSTIRDAAHPRYLGASALADSASANEPRMPPGLVLSGRSLEHRLFPVAILTVQVNNLSPRNDPRHQAGLDLQAVAQRMRLLLRPTDLLLRGVAGDFAAVVANIDKASSQTVETRMRDELGVLLGVKDETRSITLQIDTAGIYESAEQVSKYLSEHQMVTVVTSATQVNASLSSNSSAH